MASFTATQGRYLSFIQAYTNLHGRPPAESEIALAMCVSPPSVNQMVKALEKKGLILRQPGVPRSLRVLVPEEEILPWNRHGSTKSQQNAVNQPPQDQVTSAPPVILYVLKAFLTEGPTSDTFANKEISRMVEIRGDQTLAQLHECLFQAFDRWDEHLYEFQFGKRPHDPNGLNFGVNNPHMTRDKSTPRDAATTTLDQLKLVPSRTFGYWFDFGDSWYHQVQVERIETAIPTVTYPRVIRRVGKSPPQYEEETE